MVIWVQSCSMKTCVCVLVRFRELARRTEHFYFSLCTKYIDSNYWNSPICFLPSFRHWFFFQYFKTFKLVCKKAAFWAHVWCVVVCGVFKTRNFTRTPNYSLYLELLLLNIRYWYTHYSVFQQTNQPTKGKEKEKHSTKSSGGSSSSSTHPTQIECDDFDRASLEMLKIQAELARVKVVVVVGVCLFVCFWYVRGISFFYSSKGAVWAREHGTECLSLSVCMCVCARIEEKNYSNIQIVRDRRWHHRWNHQPNSYEDLPDVEWIIIWIFLRLILALRFRGEFPIEMGHLWMWTAESAADNNKQCAIIWNFDRSSDTNFLEIWKSPISKDHISFWLFW